MLSLRSEPEENGYTSTWLAGERVLCLRFTTTGRTVVNRAASMLKSLLADWHPSETLCILLDLRHRDAIISPYALRRFRSVARFRPGVSIRVALMSDDRLSLEIASLAWRGMCLGDQCRHYLATDEQQALAWLLADSAMAVMSTPA